MDDRVRTPLFETVQERAVTGAKLADNASVPNVYYSFASQFEIRSSIEPCYIRPESKSAAPFRVLTCRVPSAQVGCSPFD